jgi:Fe-S cluster biogenesis protein NfuA
MTATQNTPGKLLQQVEAALDEVRPYLKTDNGNVSIIEVTDDNIVRLKFEGACSSCSMSSMTLKAGIEETILRMVPQIKSVEAVNVQ